MDILEDFGKKDGVEVSNRNEVLKKIDDVVGPANVELMHFTPNGYLRIPFTNKTLTWNWLGHSAVRYRTSDGKDRVMDISKKWGRPNIRFYDPEDYFFSLGKGSCKEQMGMYNREITTIRGNVEPGKVDQLHQYYLDLKEDKTKRFNLLAPILNVVTRIIPGLPEYGNCAMWTTNGLKHIGFLKRFHSWPCTGWIERFESTEVKDNKKVDTSVVHFKRIQHCHHIHGINGNCFDGVALGQWIRSQFYTNKAGFADVIVDVKEGSTEATVTKMDNPYLPSKYRNMANGPVVFIATMAINIALFRFTKRKVRNWWYQTPTKVKMAKKAKKKTSKSS